MINCCEQLCGLNFIQECLNGRDELLQRDLLVPITINDCREFSY